MKIFVEYGVESQLKMCIDAELSYALAAKSTFVFPVFDCKQSKAITNQNGFVIVKSASNSEVSEEQQGRSELMPATLADVMNSKLNQTRRIGEKLCFCDLNYL